MLQDETANEHLQQHLAPRSVASRRGAYQSGKAGPRPTTGHSSSVAEECEPSTHYTYLPS